MKKLSSFEILFLGVLVLGAGTACGTQVGEDYTGEVQFTLAGNVNVDPNTPLVPRLAFFEMGGVHGVHLVDGELTGEYPQRFRFEVTKPPPESSFIEIDGIGKHVYGGFIGLFPPDIPSFLPHLSVLRDDLDDSHQWERACNAKGDCRIREFACTHEPCELLAETGDPTLEHDNASNAGAIHVGDGVSQSLLSYCDQAGNCYRQYFECRLGDLSKYDRLFYTHVERCSLLDESGDTSLVDFRDFMTIAEHQLVFMTRPFELWPEIWLHKGYNLIEYDLLSREEFLQAPLYCNSDDPAHCIWQSHVRVVEGEEINMDLGPPPAP